MGFELITKIGTAGISGFSGNMGNGFICVK